MPTTFRAYPLKPGSDSKAAITNADFFFGWLASSLRREQRANTILPANLLIEVKP